MLLNPYSVLNDTPDKPAMPAILNGCTELHRWQHIRCTIQPQNSLRCFEINKGANDEFLTLGESSRRIAAARRVREQSDASGHILTLRPDDSASSHHTDVTMSTMKYLI
jgi:hypothetical protein